MASDAAIRRYRRWYGYLLRLYPGPFRERFGEPMEQTFTDLCRERADTNRGFHAFALGAFAETSAGIMRENMTHVLQNRKVVRWVIATALILLVPLVAMLLQVGILDPGGTSEPPKWGLLDFVLVGILVLGTGLLYELATRQASHLAHRLAVGIAVGAALLLVWVNLAVGMIGSEDNPANGMYVAVLAVGLIGATIARLEPKGMALALFATAIAHTLVAVVALIAGFGPTLPLDAVFIALWVISGLLFREAGLASSPAR